MMNDGKKSSDLHKYEKGELKVKRTASSYMYFMGANIPKLMKDQKMTLPEASKESTEIWKKMEDSEKKPYEDLSLKDRKRHDKETEEFDNKGYFTLPDGTLSCDVKAKVKRPRKSA